MLSYSMCIYVCIIFPNSDCGKQTLMIEQMVSQISLCSTDTDTQHDTNPLTGCRHIGGYVCNDVHHICLKSYLSFMIYKTIPTKSVSSFMCLQLSINHHSSCKNKTFVSFSWSLLFQSTTLTCFVSVSRLFRAFLRVSPERPQKTLRKNRTLWMQLIQVSPSDKCPTLVCDLRQSV